MPCPTGLDLQYVRLLGPNMCRENVLTLVYLNPGILRQGQIHGESALSAVYLAARTGG